MKPASPLPARQCIVCAPGIELCRYDGLLDTFAPHAHPYYVVGLVRSGMRAMTCGSKHYALQPGDVVVFNPCDAHGCKSIGGVPFSYEGLRLDSQTVEDILGRTPRFEGPVLRNRTCTDAFAAVSVHALEAPWNRTALVGSLATLLALLPAERPASPQPPDDLDRVAYQLADRPGAPCSLDALASQLGLSRFTTSRAFSERFGLSPDAFMQSARIERARSLLEDGTPPATVAQLLGYSDQAHLTRMFKQRMGLTPGAYRQAHLRTVRKESA